MGRRYHIKTFRKNLIASKRSGLHSENITMFVILSITMVTIITITYFTSNARELMRTQARHVGTSRVVQLPKDPPVAQPMSNPKSGDHFTHNLWNFAVSDGEKLFLYQHFLDTPWTPNNTNLQLWRSEWREATGNFSADKNFILTHENVKENDSLIYSLYRKSKRKPTKLFKVNQHLIDNLPDSSPLDGARLGRCSVIGNSGIIQGSGCGKEIDDTDFVYRCNTAPLKPFRSDAGMKSNITTMNPSIIERKFNSLKKEANITSFMKTISQYNGHIWLPCFGVSSHTGTCLKTLDVYNQSSPTLLVANPSHFRRVWDFWKERKFGTEALSTGFYLVNIALSICEETHLYGFWPFSAQLDLFPGQVRDIPYHYFDDLKLTKNHDMNKEFQVLLQMHKHGLLRMHVGKCS